MALFLLSVKPTDFQDGHLVPLLRLSEFHDRPELGRIGAGTMLELLRPDGSRTWAWVVDVYSDDIHFFERGNEDTLYEIRDNPHISLKFSPTLTEREAPIGTEIWIVNNK